MKNRLVKLFILVAILVGLLFSSILIVNYQRRVEIVSEVFTTSLKGDSRKHIESLIGSSSNIKSCGKYLWWEGDHKKPIINNGECKEWVRYDFFMKSFAFGYSSEQRLVSKYLYVSE